MSSLTYADRSLRAVLYSTASMHFLSHTAAIVPYSSHVPCHCCTLDTRLLPSTLRLSNNYFTGDVPSSAVEQFGAEAFQGNCLNEEEGIVAQKAVCDDPLSEHLALLDLYLSTWGDQWLRSDRWANDWNRCTWFGIVCSDGHVEYVPCRASHTQFLACFCCFLALAQP
jgi:hypothetical protein